MPPAPDDGFRDLLADRSESAFADFVAALWRARGREVRRDGDRLLVGDGELRPVLAVDPDASPGDAVVVSATEPPPEADDAVVGPAALREALLYDVPRERAADLFESHFERPLEDTWTDRRTGASERDADDPPDGDDPADGSHPDASTAEAPVPSRRAGPARRLATVARLPRDRVDVRAALGDRRVQAAAVAMLAVLAGTGWGLFLHQPAPSTPGDTPFAAAESTPPTDGSYRAVGEVYRSGSGSTMSLTQTVTYAPGDPTVAVRTSTLSLGSPGDAVVTMRQVEFQRGYTAYVRETWSNRTFYERAVDGVDPDRTDDAARSLYRTSEEADRIDAAPWQTVPGLALRVLPYERRGTTTADGRRVVRFVPTAGWTIRGGPGGRPRHYRVRAAAGEVLVDAETGALVSADVEATVLRASTWGEVVSGVLTGSTEQLRVRYRVERDVDRPEAPPWVEGLNEDTTPENLTTG